MTPFLRVKCHASGLFAMDKDIKVRRGSMLDMRRNPRNLRGTSLQCGSDIIQRTSL